MDYKKTSDINNDMMKNTRPDNGGYLSSRPVVDISTFGFVLANDCAKCGKPFICDGDEKLCEDCRKLMTI